MDHCRPAVAWLKLTGSLHHDSLQQHLPWRVSQHSTGCLYMLAWLSDSLAKQRESAGSLYDDSLQRDSQPSPSQHSTSRLYMTGSPKA